MRQIGNRVSGDPARTPSAEALHAAAIHQATGGALAAVATTGIRKGIYRFGSHAEMNRLTDEALALAVATNARARSGRS